jgi:hypothetical protein
MFSLFYKGGQQAFFAGFQLWRWRYGLMRLNGSDQVSVIKNPHFCGFFNAVIALRSFAFKAGP